MAWLESHQPLADHPKTKKAARLMKASVPAVIGHLHLLWWWAMDYAQDGDLSAFSSEDIATASRWTKNPAIFIDALADCGPAGKYGFLERDGDSIRIHDWHEYAGRLLDKRRADAKRKRDVRGTSDGHPADGAGTYIHTYRQDKDAPADIPDDAAFKDRYGTLVTACGGSLDRRATDEFQQIAEDFPLEEINAAIRKCREDNVRPWASEVRKRLPKPKDPNTPPTPAERLAYMAAHP